MFFQRAPRRVVDHRTSSAHAAARGKIYIGYPFGSSGGVRRMLKFAQELIGGSRIRVPQADKEVNPRACSQAHSRIRFAPLKAKVVSNTSRAEVNLMRAATGLCQISWVFRGDTKSCGISMDRRTPALNSNSPEFTPMHTSGRLFGRIFS